MGAAGLRPIGDSFYETAPFEIQSKSDRAV
jgi:hypothetical protein